MKRDMNTKPSTILFDYSIGQSIAQNIVVIDEKFHDEESTYGVYTVRLSDERSKASFTINGYFPYKLHNKLTYKLNGKVEMYEQEKQVKVSSIYLNFPDNEQQLLMILQQLEGMNKRAKAIVERYGIEALSIMLEKPEKIANEFVGVSLKLAEQWSMQLHLRFAHMDVREQLKLWGFTEKQTESIAQKFGQASCYLFVKIHIF